MANNIDMKEEKKPKAGQIEFDKERKMWVVFNGAYWVDVDLKEHKCNFKNET